MKPFRHCFLHTDKLLNNLGPKRKLHVGNLQKDRFPTTTDTQECVSGGGISFSVLSE